MTFKSIGQSTQAKAGASLSVVGNKPGGTDVVQSHHNSSEIGTWLAKQKPCEMDKAAVLRAQQHGVSLSVNYQGRYPVGKNGEYGNGYRIGVGCDIHVKDGNVAAALADLENFNVPADIRQVEGWLAELSVIVAKRVDSDFAEELRLAAYASRLCQYPADVARHAVLGVSYQFWPTWQEMERHCEEGASPRRCMIAALKRGPKPPEPEYGPATDAEKARTQELVDAVFPSKSAADRKAATDEIMSGNCMKVDTAAPANVEAN